MKNSKKSAPSADIAAASAALLDAVAPAKPQIDTAPAEKSVASRAGWTGVLSFDLLTFGIKSYKATEEEKFSLNRIYVSNQAEIDKAIADNEKLLANGLDAKKFGDALTPVPAPIYAQVKNGSGVGIDGKPVADESILYGYKFAEGEYVTISDDEKKACMVNSDKKMDILEFVPADSVDPIYFEQTQYIAPEKGYEIPFALLREGMVNRGVVAIAQSNQRGREQTLILRPYGETGITAHYMYFDNEVRSFDKWTKVNVTDVQANATGALIDAMTSEFDPTQYSDSYTRRFKGLINDKIAGKVIDVPTPAPQPTADPKMDVMALLAASMTSPKAEAIKAKKALKSKAFTASV